MFCYYEEQTIRGSCRCGDVRSGSPRRYMGQSCVVLTFSPGANPYVVVVSGTEILDDDDVVVVVVLEYGQIGTLV